MSDREKWSVLDEFPDYAVSDQGRVMTIKTELIKTPSLNQQGIPNVLFVVDGVQHRRALARLVADMYIPRPHMHFDTPINLNGDRLDCRRENLMWRPRWFAMKYHRQFKPGYVPAINKPIIETRSGDEYANSLEASKVNGILDDEILIAMLNRTYVFPTHQSFEIIEK